MLLQRFAIALIATGFLSMPAMAELWQDTEPQADPNGWQNSEATTGQAGHVAQQTDTVNAPQPGGNTAIGGSGTRGSSNQTNKQASCNIPVGNGAPILGSFAAPGNLALLEEGSGVSLKQTRLDSLMGSGLDSSFGDEGTDGPPPLDYFTGIQDAGGVNSLTTGHQSNAPSPVSQGPGM